MIILYLSYMIFIIFMHTSDFGGSPYLGARMEVLRKLGDDHLFGRCV